MSLFGSSSDDSVLSATPARSEQKSSLFDDEQPSQGGSTLFNDDTNDGDSPWSMPTPKKTSKSDPVKILLPGNNVPESYIDAFDVLRNTQYGTEDGKITIAGVRKLVEGSGLKKAEQDRIINLVAGGQDIELGQSEVNVLLALIGLSQEGEEESTLDSVDERRKSISHFAVRSCHC